MPNGVIQDVNQQKCCWGLLFELYFMRLLYINIMFHSYTHSCFQEVLIRLTLRSRRYNCDDDWRLNYTEVMLSCIVVDCCWWVRLKCFGCCCKILVFESRYWQIEMRGIDFLFRFSFLLGFGSEWVWFGSVKQEVKVIWQKAPHGGPISRLGVTPGVESCTIEFLG